jgi:class 3 adenylate cyclase
VATNDQDHALRAVGMALEMQGEPPRSESAGSRRNREAVRGAHGYQHRLRDRGRFRIGRPWTYTAIGTQTNLAARIEEISEPGQIWISHSTWVLCRNAFECEEKGEVVVKGIRSPVKLYRVLDRRAAGGMTAASPRL